MRTEVATMQQTLTPEAAAVLTRSIEEAGRRRHGQTTPLHVAANLLASPSGLLRRACAASHPLLSSSSHPLHCRALELCFSVALDRLQAGGGVACAAAALDGSDAERPPLSNALVAAVKRAQAHHRRGCSDQQPPPSPLAAKVDLAQLVVSILDDPSVSRVMREAGFSSPAVKSAIEQSTNMPRSPAARNLYVSPLLRQEAKEREEVKKVIEVMTRVKKRNPVLVGDSDAARVMNHVFQLIEKRELGVPAEVISLEWEFTSLERSLIPRRINELFCVLEPKIRAFSVNDEARGLILDLGDLRWLVESSAQQQQQQQRIGRAIVAEVGRLVSRLRESGGGSGSRVWVVGTATCATYLRCQVYYPTIESEWDLQALPIAPRPPALTAGLFPRSVGNGSLSGGSIMAISPPKLSQSSALCHLCMEDYRFELANLASEENDGRSALPQWLQIAVPSKKLAADHRKKQKEEELLEKWSEKCALLHMNPNATVITRNGDGDHMPKNSLEHQTSPVRTDLVLRLSWHKSHDECPNDSPKRLLKGLTEAVSWQPEAASAIAAAIIRCKSGNNSVRAVGPKADSWLLFAGPDKVGKRKMAAALSELVFGAPPVSVRLASPFTTDGDDSELDVGFRGMTLLDRISEAVQQNPSSVIMLEGIDQANGVAQGTIKRAIRSGRLVDSRGREVVLGSIIFVLIADRWLENPRESENCHLQSEENKILDSVNSGWQLELSFKEKSGKRPVAAGSLDDDQQPMKQRKPSEESHSLDLNLAVSLDDDAEESSRNSSELTVDQEHKHGQITSSNHSELTDMVDEAIVFKPVDFGTLRERVSKSILSKFSAIMGCRQSLQIDEEALDRIVGGVWQSGATDVFDKWTDRVLVPSMNQLRSNLDVNDRRSIVRLSPVKGDGRSYQSGSEGNWFPSCVSIAIEGT